ncbi:type II secretion system ATPase GspE [Leptospira borgpetersenii]|uniref:protein-secreting ATPase n=1 Tax=Leptospira borgpetersenii serovar Ballum TaxID=280505 RepID=A0A0E3B3E0_LEPBO|nr:type II secretion system ATPase GspE [Leptospira borgpetersenii]EMO10412.1 type II secretion system protein E [Leptospira borgpetersenii str. Noumea 25]ALO25782.1 type II secretion system protein E [Leptospira borgpetersenii serovar Ballum]ANH00596.1 Type II secretion system protein E [Leptospira borgpetersenii str. 4E]EKR00409.1 type II secretion system protein E [Leptospira borgpetersenii serovar Castellonis str. 200801910]KGE23909.1 general secretion pathway protein GspE [Leptospira borg
MKTLGDILIEEGIISEKDLEDSLKVQKKNNLPLSHIIQKKGIAGETDILRALSKLYQFEFREKLEFTGIEDVFLQIPLKLLQRSRIVPFQLSKKTIRVAVSDPSDLHPMDDVRNFLKGYNVEFVLAPEPEIMRIIHSQFDTTSSSAKEMLNEMEGSFSELAEAFENETLDLSDDAPIIKMVNVILSQAVNERASDIHIEPYEKSLVVRYRVDGILHNVLSPPKSYHAGISSRIKIMSNLNIAENRLPQDGRIKLRLAGKDIDIRVSTIPCQFGERIVMRLLNKTDQKYSLDTMGFYPDLIKSLRSLIYEPHGIVLVTGPTGSGKSTTLYSALSELNTEERNIITCEDPVEYQIEGISQMQMQEKIGLTFATGLRAILRQDPDVIMVGEIRDEETARIAIQASLTGHLVFSTLHTNDAASAATRLIDMGIEPYLITSTVLGFMAQRLVRVICTQCKEIYKPTTSELESIGISRKVLKNGNLHRGKGCSHCMGTGFKGRTGIYELLLVNSHIKHAILQGKDAGQLNEIALEHNFQTLKDYGVKKIIDGVTTIDEVLRVT